jgi:hypothetical protein
MHFNCNGLWWLPQSPELKTAGSLEYSEEGGAQLSLSGTLGVSHGHFEEKTLPVIHGLVYDCPLGNALTLKDSVLRSFSLGMPGFGRETYRVRKIFGGQHLDANELQFSDVTLRYSGLSGWAHGLTGITQDHTEKTTWRIGWSSPHSLEGRVYGAALNLGVSALVSFKIRQASIMESVQIALTFDEPQSDEAIESKYAYPLQNFFSLATDQPNSLDYLSVRRPIDSQNIQIIAHRVFRQTKEPDYPLAHKMIFSLEDVKERAISLMARWLEVYPRLNRICAPYFAIQYRPSFTDLAYLTNFQCLQVCLSSRTSVVDEKSRLQDLLKEYWEVVGVLFKGDPDSISSKLMDLRNYVVHRTSNLGEQPGYGAILYFSAQRLGFLLKAYLLTEIGLSKEDITGFFFRNQMFLYLRSVADKYS